MSRSVAFDAFCVAERCCALSRAADLDAPAVKRLLARGEALPETMSTATSDGRLDYVGGRLADGHRVPGDRLGKYWLGGVHPEKRARVAARRLASVESGVSGANRQGLPGDALCRHTASRSERALRCPVRTRVILPARFEKVASARDAVRTLLGAARAPEEAISLTELAAGELVANAIRHGSGSVVEFAVRLGDASAAVSVTNAGPVFEYRAIDLKALQFEESGRGLAMLVALGCALNIDDTERGLCTVTANVPFTQAEDGGGDVTERGSS